MNAIDNFTAKLTMIRQRLNRIQSRQVEHFRLFKRLNTVNTNLKAMINVLNTISVTSLVLTHSGTSMTLIVCTVSNTLSAICTAVMSVVHLDDKVHRHQTSYLQFVELYETYIAELLTDDLNGTDLDRILMDLNSKVGLIMDNCEPINVSQHDLSSIQVQHQPASASSDSPYTRYRTEPCATVCPSIQEVVVVPSTGADRDEERHNMLIAPRPHRAMVHTIPAVSPIYEK